MLSFDVTGPYEVGWEDLEYASPDQEPLLVRMYRPIHAAWDVLPALIDVHGGAWNYFDRTIDEYFNRALSACGMVVLAVDFRGGRTHRFPTAIADVVAAIRWARANAERLLIDPTTLGLVGGSSGAHIAALAALQPSNPDFLTTPFHRIGPSYPPPDEISAEVSYLLPLWGVMDPLGRYRYLLEAKKRFIPDAQNPLFHPERLMEAQNRFFGDQATMLQASAVRMLSAGEAEKLPPIFVAHPELDDNVPLEMTTEFVDAYRQAGGSATLEIFAGVGHSFANFPGEQAERCIQKMRLFVAKQLAPSANPAAARSDILTSARAPDLTDGSKKVPLPIAAGVVSPGKLAHFVLRTSRKRELEAFYCRLLGARVVFSNSQLSFLTYDDEHHRLGIVQRDDLGPSSLDHAGLEHVGFTYRSLGDLLSTYHRLKKDGMLPFWCVNHGTTTSMYYVDPDMNQIELQIENYATLEALNAWLKSGAFKARPLGINFDPEQVSARYEVGVPWETLVWEPWEQLLVSGT